jgi:nucleotide-binding universal stress UspA family protein
MPVKNVFVTVEADTAGKARLEFAADVARAHEAHLTGAFFFNPLVPEVTALAVEYCAAGSVEELRNPEYTKLLHRSEQATELFEECLRRNGLNGEWHISHRIEHGLVRLARLSDLVIAGQTHPTEHDGNAANVLDRLLAESGRPVVVVPCFGHYNATWSSILIGWDGSREAARAVHDAMPFLKHAKQATVFSLEGPEQDIDLPDTDIAASLGRHGIAITAARSTSGEIAISDALLNYAADTGADLLVVGGYGHSPLREAVFGGVTRELLRHMTVPILFSH